MKSRMCGITTVFVCFLIFIPERVMQHVVYQVFKQSRRRVRSPATFDKYLSISELRITLAVTSHVCQCTLIAHNYAFYAARDGGEYLVRYGTKDGGKFRDRGVSAKNSDSVTHLAGDAGNVKHAHVHAYIADGGSTMPIYTERCCAAAKVAVNSIGIPHGNGGDDGALGGFAPSAITYGVSGA